MQYPHEIILSYYLFTTQELCGDLGYVDGLHGNEKNKKESWCIAACVTSIWKPTGNRNMHGNSSTAVWCKKGGN